MAPTFEEVFPVLYRGWDPVAARADFNAGGWMNKAGVEQFIGGGTDQSPIQSADDIIQSSIDVWSKLMEEAKTNIGKYQTQYGQFNADDVLREKAGQISEQIDPYYTRLRGDYQLGIDRKIERGGQDLRDLLGELSAQTTSYSESAQLKLNEAIGRAREGYADSGLFESGQRLRSEGLAQTEAGMEKEDFLRRQGVRAKLGETAQARSLQDIATERPMQLEQLRREQNLGREQLGTQFVQEAKQKYVTGAYGVLPPALQANQNFDLVKQLGIYQ